MTKQKTSLQRIATRDRPFSLTVERQPRGVVVRMSGACTMEVSGQISERMVVLASEPGCLLALDLSALDFIESTGLGGIVAGYVRARRKHGEVRLVAPSQPIRDVLQLTRLTELFQVFATIEEALTAPIGP
jgi:anti-sigma B factor antagonist